MDGKANERLIQFLGGRLAVSSARIKIVRGMTGCDQKVLVTDLQPEELQRLGRVRVR